MCPRDDSPAKARISAVRLFVASIFFSLLITAFRFSNVLGRTSSYYRQEKTNVLWKLKAIQELETRLPDEVRNAIAASTNDSGILSLDTRQRDLPASWNWEIPTDVAIKDKNSEESDIVPMDKGISPPEDAASELESDTKGAKEEEEIEESLIKSSRRELRQQRKLERLKELLQQKETSTTGIENASNMESKESTIVALKQYSIWKHDIDDLELDSLIKLIQGQINMAKVYARIALVKSNITIYNLLMFHIRESRQLLNKAFLDSDLENCTAEKVAAMAQILSTTRQQLYDCGFVSRVLRTMLQSSENQVKIMKKQTIFLDHLAAKTIPRNLHCLSMKLAIDYFALPHSEQNFPNKENLEDPNLYHYALFSDNILAASVVVSSTVLNAKEPEKHVFHLVTDRSNFEAMKMWFLNNPPGKATIQVQKIDDFKWLNSSNCPVLRQLESAALKEYYFTSGHRIRLKERMSNLKYRNPKYLSILNHLRFYIPEIYPKLHKILFLDDDVVVQKDLSPLWSVNLKGRVNGAVETCGETFHRFKTYLNFSNPLIGKNFDSNACGWAFGMNIFDLKEWRKHNITANYQRWQSMNDNRTLWKLGTLPPGLIVFYNLTYSLQSPWHVLGLGYDPNVDISDIESAAVIHYNGNKKPWLELAIPHYRSYWKRYISLGNPYLQQCGIGYCG